MSGDYITVGAPESGRAYIYNSNTCALLHTLGTGLTPGVIKTGFSNRLDMDGDNIIVGTVGLGNPEAAHAHIFSASTGSLLRTIVYSDANNAYPSTDDSFGRQCLKISGNYALIGVHNEDSVGDNAGMAILYNITDGSIVYSIQGEDADDLFGDQGDISGGTIAISARNVSGSNAPGYIKVYQGVEVSETILSTTSAVATTSYVDTAITNLVDSSPAALNTLNELAAALGDDANFSTTVTNSIASKADDAATTSALATKAPLASPTFTGVPVAPTATAGTNTTQIATTAFVTAATVAAAGDTLPAQTGNTGKYLTTDGSTTSWATVASGAGYEIGDGLELQGVTSYDWSTLPAPTASFIGTTINGQLGSLLAASSSYVVTVLRGPDTTFGVYNAQTGSFERSITKPGSGNTYGGKLDISGTKIIFGNYESSGNAGAAAIFEATTGNQIHSLSTTGTAYAGAGVAISPTYAAVNSFSADNVDSYVDIYSVSTGNKIYTISNPDIVPTGGEATFDDSFGIIISMSDSYLVVAALNEEAADGTTNSGVVYVFDTPTGTLLHTLIPSSPVANAQYGYTVALHGDYIAVGTSAGPYVFIYSASTGSLLRTISDPQPGDNKFGSGWAPRSAISIDGNYLLVGAPNTNPSVELEVSGAAYLFDITNGNLLHTISATSSRQGLGSATALAPGVLAVASKYFDNGSSDSEADYGKIDLYKTNTSTINYLKPDSTIATTSYVDTAVSNLVDSSPAALNTLNELAAALGDDANFATTVTNTLAEKAPLASPTFTGVTTLTATSEVLQPKFSAGFGAVDHDIANGSIFYHDNMMGNFDAAFINVPTTVDLVTSAVLVMADGQMWGPSSYVRVNGTEYVVKWLGGTAPTMSADVVDVVSYSLINRNGTWVVIGSHSAYSAAV
jgi:hypothetical protein